MNSSAVGKFSRSTRVIAASLATSAGLAFGATSTAQAGEITPVPKLDVARYLGDWYQIADIPQWYESFCERDTKANYTLNSNGTVKVRNTCSGPYNFPIALEGRARVVNETTKSSLQVTFLNFFGHWIEIGSKPNYNVLGIADDYSWAVVGENSRSSAYVLSRTKTLTPDQKASTISVLNANGYTACSLKTTVQTGAEKAVKNYC